jgi:hypothetical protein
MDFVILFGAFVFGMIGGWHLREYYAMRKVHQLLQQAEELSVESEQTSDEDRTKMRLERHGEVIYAFEEETDSFIAQGKDLLDLDSAIRKRFPDKKFTVQEQNLKDIGAEYHEPV